MKNNQLLFLHAVLTNNPLTVFDKEVRADLFKLKNNLEKPIQDYNNKRKMIFLLNDSVEKEDKDGNKTLQMPDLPVRAKETGTDDEFKAKALKVMAIRTKIEDEINLLNDTKIDIKIERILTDEQFDKIGEIGLPLDWESLREVLVKNKG